MPMIDIQRRHAEAFRLRFGDRGPNGAPRKLTEAIRVTAPTEAIVQAFVDRYGGEVQSFTERVSRDKFQAYLPTTSISIMVLPGDSFQQWWELYKGSVCDRRCDGVTEQKSGKPCSCPADIDERMKDRQACSPTTRVSLLCPDVAVIGSGSFVTHGLIAAETLPQSIAVAAAALSRGLMVPATLTVSEVKGRNHFIFPQIVITGMSLGELVSGSMSVVAEVGSTSGERLAIGAGVAPSFTPVPVDELPAGPQPSVAEQVTAVNDPAPRKARANAQAPIPSTGLKPRTAAQAAQSTPAVSAPTPAASNGGPVCGACGLSLAGCAVKIEGGVRMHKDGCPTGSGPDGPGAAHESEPVHEPNATTGLEREPIDVEAEQVPAASTQSDDTVYRDVDIHQLAAETFARAKDEAPRGQKSKIVDRCRHVLTHAITEGRTSSLKDLSAREKHRLWMELTWIKDGHRTYEVTADALIVTNDGRETVMPFADESEAA